MVKFKMGSVQYIWCLTQSMPSEMALLVCIPAYLWLGIGR